MDQIEIALALAIGFAGGYGLRSVISAVRRRRAYQLRRANALRSVAAARLFANRDSNTQTVTTIPLSPSEAP
jgi:hypothetical protein